jgi:hypothetical protein
MFVLCICSLLNKTNSISDYTVSENDKVSKGCGRKGSWPNLRYYPSIFLEGLSKTTKNVSHNNWSLGQDLNQAPLLHIKYL